MSDFSEKLSLQSMRESAQERIAKMRTEGQAQAREEAQRKADYRQQERLAQQAHEKEKQREFASDLQEKRQQQAFELQTQRDQARLQAKELELQGKHEQALELTKLAHNLDIEIRERNRQDAVFFGNLRLQELAQELRIRDKYEGVTFDRLLDQLYVELKGRLMEKELDHKLEKDRMTHENKLKMEFEVFMMELKQAFGVKSDEELLEQMGKISDRI